MSVPEPGADGLRRYGTWSGRPGGIVEDETRCIFEVWPNERGATGHQCQNRRGRGPGGLYCSRHDPDLIRVKVDRIKKKEEERKRRDDAIQREAERIGRALGVKATARWGDFQRGYMEDVIVSFDDARALIARLKREGA